jgi:Ca2+-binding EF-hand superfamily protein
MTIMTMTSGNRMTKKSLSCFSFPINTSQNTSLKRTRTLYIIMSLTEDQVLELQRSFHAFDTNGSGFIEMDELKEGLKLLGYNISDKGIDHLLSLVESADDRLNFEEFIAWNGLLWKDEMKAKFREIDADSSGWIGKNELKQWAMDMGHGFTEEEIDDMCYEMDSSGDDRISVDEFIKGMVRAWRGQKMLAPTCNKQEATNLEMLVTSGSFKRRQFLFRNQRRDVY